MEKDRFHWLEERGFVPIPDDVQYRKTGWWLVKLNKDGTIGSYSGEFSTEAAATLKLQTDPCYTGHIVVSGHRLMQMEWNDWCKTKAECPTATRWVAK